MISISPSRSPSGLRDHSRHPSGDTASAMQGSVSGQSAGPSGSLDDPMYSLRAAALMTLKSKRRKPANSVEQTVSLSTRPAHVHPDIQLDYGDEASSAVNGSRTPIASTNEGPITAPDQGRSTDAMDIEEGQIREEGEISDTETPPPPQPYTTSPSKDLASSSKAPKAVAPPTLAARLGLKTSDAEHASTSAPVTASRTPASVSENILTGSWVLSPTPLSGFSLGDAAADISRAEIVRPGLALNAQQYETAKDIVLDLLGWGVPPEFLVSCGLSREIVFYVFSDLNLRLPANLDTTGLIPDASHEGQTFAPISTLAETQISLLGLPTNDNRHPSSSHHNLPPKPAASQFGLPSKPLPGSSSAPELGSVDSSPVITPATSVNGTNLHDIEQLRRQELLARKAVQASRKAKHPSLDIETAVASARPSSIVTALSDVEMSMPVPDETVDDFLKSIGPTSSVLPGLEIGRESLGQGRSTSRDDMDVDTPVLKVPQHTSQGNRPLSAQSAGMSLSPVTPSEIAVSSSGGPPSSTASTFSSMLSNGDVDTMTELEPRASVLPPTLRRGTKRPVAADFVDMEPGPSRPHPLSISSFARSTLSATRKPGSFASVSGMRRCVIDLSDSEEEEDESNDVSRREQGSFSPMPSSARASGTVSTRTITPPGSNVPPDLLEKEREIQRMRELIAQKEQRRHRKLAETSRPFSALSSPSTPHPFSTQGAPSDVSSASNLKVDDDEASAAALALHRTGRMSAYLLNGDNETADEDSVMRDLTAESQVPDDPTSVTSLTPEAVTPIGSHSFQFVGNALSN
ncbi:hypothetical protein NEOLEDRAFT_169350 [Neolentinus lepideus HHB14362 ss-1]|uniref:Uncharacterized protein n=1 Tax=Neolentinus lepideus HHB14362 ss-1 TaxID=1314782 RepID=A0A165MK51_9AGAM|nr:hypothetical protein NEOLEDRAFT_169350 [Neolentinus lepideus HHB14362 ss-1]